MCNATELQVDLANFGDTRHSCDCTTKPSSFSFFPIELRGEYHMVFARITNQLFSCIHIGGRRKAASCSVQLTPTKKATCSTDVCTIDSSLCETDTEDGLETLSKRFLEGSQHQNWTMRATNFLSLTTNMMMMMKISMLFRSKA